MKTLEDIRGCCIIDEDGHWLWQGGKRSCDGRPSIYAPDYSIGGMRTQCGTRAVWHCSTGRPIPKGWRAYGICEFRECCNPRCIRCTSQADYGVWKAQQGDLKGQTTRILANRAICRARSNLTPELIFQIQSSPETGTQLAARLGMPTSVISKARRGEMRAFTPAGLFAGLGAP